MLGAPCIIESAVVNMTSYVADILECASSCFLTHLVFYENLGHLKIFGFGCFHNQLSFLHACLR